MKIKPFVALVSLAAIAFIIAPASTSLIAQTEPVFDAYRGVKIGMAAEKARETLGKAKDESDKEDYYDFDNGESARVIYDAEKNVRVISATYSKNLESAPQPQDVVGEMIKPNEDGGMFKMVRYPSHGFWITYVKIAGDEPMIIITMQKMRT
ncbi:hypothetical protein BH24ACI3_BH24ACI3_05360 [soil metagenome]